MKKREMFFIIIACVSLFILGLIAANMPTEGNTAADHTDYAEDQFGRGLYWWTVLYYEVVGDQPGDTVLVAVDTTNSIGEYTVSLHTGWYLVYAFSNSNDSTDLTPYPRKAFMKAEPFITMAGDSTFFDFVKADSGFIGDITGDIVSVARLTVSDSLTAGGHVQIDSTLTVGVDDTGYDVNFHGATSKSRFLWDESKMALRAGIENNDQWADVSTGIYSTAWGLDCMAMGQAGFASGTYSKAGSHYSTAIGYRCTTASGAEASIAMGRYAAVGDDQAIAIGDQVDADAFHSFVLGNYLTASDSGCMIIGSGIDNTDRLVNDTKHSLMIGFNDTLPSLHFNSSPFDTTIYYSYWDYPTMQRVYDSLSVVGDDRFLRLHNRSYADTMIGGLYCTRGPQGMGGASMSESGITIGDNATWNKHGLFLEEADSLKFGTGPAITATATKIEINEKLVGPGFTIGDEDSVLVIDVSLDGGTAAYVRNTGMGRAILATADVDSSTGYGVTGRALSDNSKKSDDLYGVRGIAQNYTGTPPPYKKPPHGYGVYGYVVNCTTGYGIYGKAENNDTNWAAYFADGDVKVENDLNIDGNVSADTTKSAVQGNLVGNATSADSAGKVDVSSIGWAQGIWYAGNAVYIEPLTQYSGIEFITQDQRGKIAVDVDGTTITRTYAGGLHVIGGDVDYASIASTCTTWAGSGTVNDSLAALRTDVVNLDATVSTHGDSLTALTTDIAALQATKVDTSDGLYVETAEYTFLSYSSSLPSGTDAFPILTPRDTIRVVRCWASWKASSATGAYKILVRNGVAAGTDTIGISGILQATGWNEWTETSPTNAIVTPAQKLCVRITETVDGTTWYYAIIRVEYVYVNP